ncbi:hypothetical protein CSC81_00175 [Tenacibaculum discolor]|uniref:Uncharacterized protein n=1 Tax=Tenacibaculum discolor TaxID=361581 RepID=A0A2G1BYJ6_9FLAO|nr:hypothetical protein [Tenacibaculum discolor]MDP2541478.1 hypothetical protein [Tenacibaculum discolor]PHN99074.1 hypothetical protein CSC81_00175 [Tenacibaculum discolor]PHO00773.1 hypothetical protein CSC82_27080 [Rhodobacteraceae bacterium 4F10]
MGENKDIKELDAFTKKYINEIEAETPSIDFTANIMDAILKEEQFSIYKAAPLISKRVWFVLAGILAVSILFVSKGASSSWLQIPEIKMDYLSNIQLPNLFENITVSNLMLSACFFFTVMVFVQIYYLKNHFTRKFN